MLPGVVYGLDEDAPGGPKEMNLLVQIDKRQVEREIRVHGRMFESVCYELMLDDNSSHLVIPRQVHVNPSTYFLSLLIYTQ